MHPKRIFLTFFLGFIFFFTFSQEIPISYAVCDWSFGFFNSEPTDIDRIRGSVASFSAENSNKGLTCISFRGTTGIKFETLLLSRRIGLGAGIRFSQFVQNTGKWEILTEGVNYFYFLYAQDEQNTYYARLKSILQTSGYLGIPAEFTFFPLENQHLYRFYMKMGAEIDFRVSTHTKVQFMNEGMPSLESQVTSHISSPSPVGFSFYNCMGIRAGVDGKPTFSVELLIPLLNTNPGSPGLLKNKFGAGLQFNYHIPIQSRNR
jgi:hypothetical protein